MPRCGIGTTMIIKWYLFLMTINLVQGESLFGSGTFSNDPFAELGSILSTTPAQKSNKSDPPCFSNGAIASSIIATLLLSAFIGFLTWLIYLRQQLQELRLYQNGAKQYIQSPTDYHSSISDHKQDLKKQYRNDEKSYDVTNKLPLEVTEFKFGTYPFHQSQMSSSDGHYNHTSWFNRIPSSFRSVTVEKDTHIIDVELLNPKFCGLNFSITGSMRNGIFVKEILNRELSDGTLKLNSSDQLRTGDRILALTVCFESIVYEDALTILSYASPYPVIIRVQRPIHSPTINSITEKQRSTVTNKVKWRDDFDHYDNDTPHNHSLVQQDLTTVTPLDIKSKSSKKSHSKKSPITDKSNHTSKVQSDVTRSKFKHSNIDTKNDRNKKLNQTLLTSTGITSKTIDKIPTTAPGAGNKSTMKSVTNAVISYLHYRGTNGGHVTDATNSSEAALMPYYDSPYDYYGLQASQSYLNKNNNNSLSAESLTAVTSIYTIELSPSKAAAENQRSFIPRRCERRLSSPAVMLPVTVETNETKDYSYDHTDANA